LANSYPLKEWHRENMKKRLMQYIAEPSDDTSPFQKRLYKEHAGNLVDVRKSLEFDIRHGVTKEEVITFFTQLKSDRHLIVLTFEDL
jgi:hypothetical protein